MADPYNECPPYVRNKSYSLDTLLALVPYEQVADHEVEVPPIAVFDNPFVEFVGTGANTTFAGGTKPPGVPPGWWEQRERDEKQRIRNIANDIIARDNAGELAPQVRQAVRRLANSALSDMDEVDEIYDDWNDAWVYAKSSNDPFSCYQLYDKKCPLFLSQGWQYINSQMNQPASGDETREAFEDFDHLLRGERGSWNIGDPSNYQFHEAMVEARRRDRNKILQLFKHAYSVLWCAEYGIAQGESYTENKRIWQERYGDLPKFKLEPPSDDKPKPGVPKGPMDLVYKLPDPCRDYGIDCPPSDDDDDEPEGFGEPGPEGEPPPEQPIPEPVQPKAWYQTTAGRVAIGVFSLTVVGAAGYGGYTWYRARA